MKIANYIFLIILLCLVSCKREPVAPVNTNNIDLKNNFSLIFCEGNYGLSNASISYFNLESGEVNNQFFEQINGYQIGDVLNDALLYKDFLYVVVSTSKTIYKISLKNGQVAQKLNFTGNNLPRKIVLYDDSTCFVTDAYSNSVFEINTSGMSIKRQIKVGVQPEGIGIYNNYLFTVNSGWGDINKNAPDASTISIIDLFSNQELNKIKTKNNPVELLVDSINKFLYVVYYNYPSLKDSLGGILQYDLRSFKLLQEWRGNYSNLTLSHSRDTLFMIANNTPGKETLTNGSIRMINRKTNEIKDLIINKTKDFWYSFFIDYKRNYIWVANSKNFQSSGEIYIYPTDFNNSTSNYLKKFIVGINPNKIILINN